MIKFYQNNQEYLRGLFLAIQEAKKDIYFTAYAITFTDHHPALSVGQILDEMIEARKRGVKVIGVVNSNLNIPRVYETTMKAITKLRQANCDINIFPKREIMHAKLFCVDNEKVFIGSQNLTEAGAKGQVEASVEITDSELAGLVKSYIGLLNSVNEDEVI